MKAKSLLFLRVSTGLLLLVWGLVRVAEPGIGAHVSEKYYAGLGAAHAVQLVWGAALLVVGTLTIAGLWRRIVYPAQAVVLVFGALFTVTFTRASLRAQRCGRPSGRCRRSRR